MAERERPRDRERETDRERELMGRERDLETETDREKGRQTDRQAGTPLQTAEDCRCCHHQQNTLLLAQGVWSSLSVLTSPAQHFFAAHLEASASSGLSLSSLPLRQREGINSLAQPNKINMCTDMSSYEYHWLGVGA